ncbi:aminotransferase class V-fold PLP-dependent enzyme [Caldilinea sp.]|uniref:pyridoxal phosphate-dependent decarboxylase family protein n=1 Tax=Caldilinea sp. TaxID=2293560 RepID=UPI0021DD162A|nr:aminotransferase class V-fold PLP-dependent enzyme [Caldilinea sp.]GIV70931.1 MAG: aspartate aminotransferase family protein [Caldilinea sp.]
MPDPFALLGRLPPSLAALLEAALHRVPLLRRQLERQYEALLAELDDALHPYRDKLPIYSRLPKSGRSREEILAEMRELQALEQRRWREGYVSGAVYHGDPAHIDFLNQVYALNSQSNPLHFDLWPSTVKYEAEIVSMTAHLLGADHASDPIVGAVTSGGTESILLAMRAYRDRGRAERGLKRPRVIAPVSAHAAFDKAADYFGIELVRTPVGPDLRADVEAMAAAINRNTVALVGSAPSFPHGVIDPIPELAALAQAHGVGLHVDACLGAFILPFARELGYDAPEFDFRLPGVTSMSADTHKYGYAAKGTSVVLYRGEALRRYQYYAIADWPGGLYFSPTLAGSRPGALSAACWAALVSIGEEGYRAAAAKILATARLIRCWIEQIPELEVLGDPLFVIAFASPSLDIYRVLDAMSARGWSLNGLHRPPAIHIAVTLRHTEPGVAQRFIEDLRAAVEHVKAHPAEKGGMAPVYGMAASLPMHGVVEELLRRVVDALYKVE